ncbi:GIY-YIG nuclease family protein [Streptomyces scabiei]|uniref:GIY-YIG nuclease family protein n=1 Tax=Streptomyces scabiei TaxID=1930 RepID=UPI001B3204B0|nr:MULTISPECIES: GIY-YIG nuclease family protein [Streptomyces]MBP5892819.1 GIY-YIG nuclease family protein [Streptomyces sp. LBUM 1481]MBP5923085.1 GIY-YIG nuclease family protein [Streptomyces sp. LBUM 1483]MDX2686859.1 GIY-YIG nuclease family protein [Streptomyces scabiei]MDX2753069.1 GIY-YIG nuclease family protein [Streptomyces scabiei]MDX2807258.1 GIY-YIG nuclease family protein [Streptomyces scabiei]
MQDPIRTALYRCFDADEELLYVGISYDPTARWKQHQSNSPWWRDVAVRTVEWFDDRPAAEAAERKAIQTEGPRHNVVHRPTPVPGRIAPVANPSRPQRTLADIYADKPLTDAQVRRIAAILARGGAR